jgi:hypothetical protein
MLMLWHLFLRERTQNESPHLMEFGCVVVVISILCITFEMHIPVWNYPSTLGRIWRKDLGEQCATTPCEPLGWVPSRLNTFVYKCLCLGAFLGPDSGGRVGAADAALRGALLSPG